MAERAGVMEDFFFCFCLSSGAAGSGVSSSSSEAEAEPEDVFSFGADCASKAAFCGSTYFTLMRIFLRREAGEGRVLHSVAGGVRRKGFQISFIISTIMSCCWAQAWTSRLITIGRSLWYVGLVQTHKDLVLRESLPGHECCITDCDANVSERYFLRKRIPMQYPRLYSGLRRR